MTNPSQRLSINQALDRLHADLGLRRLDPLWAKLEIFLGLLVAGVGMLLGAWAATRGEIEVVVAVSGLALFVLGGYLAMAGSRSHLYQSNNKLAAYLAELLKSSTKE